jgi:hypothetical protein
VNFSKNSSFDRHNFMPYTTLTADLDTSWPIDPALAIPYVWLSVVQNDDGLYYALFSYRNTGPRSADNANQFGTGVLYSSDGLEFNEYSSGGDTIEKLDGVIYAHPFKWTLGSSTSWYAVYLDSSLRRRYAKINWTQQFSL